MKPCRICHGTDLTMFLSLGDMPLANRFLTAAQLSEPEPRYPLEAAFCKTCNLVQLTEVVPPELMYRNYVYVSGTSAALRRHFQKFAEEVAERVQLGADDFVLEIASNDGTLLRCFQQWYYVLGVEPATNLASSAGVPVVNEFFTAALAEKIVSEHGTPKLIVATNVFAHIDDLDDVMQGIDVLLDRVGTFVIEVPYLLPLLENVEYDTIYHEHLSYFSVLPLTKLFDRHGFSISRVELKEIHGGSLRLFVNRRKNGSSDETVDEFLKAEYFKSLDKLMPYTKFSERVEHVRDVLVDLMDIFSGYAQEVIGYGAAAKANTLLNYCSIGRDQLSCIVDKNPMKQGLFTPGAHIPVRSPDGLDADYMLILAWNFADEIMREQAAFREEGGKFIIPGAEIKIC